jgi:hypothetical protein
MQKCQNSIFIFDPPTGSPFGEALAPQGDLGLKKCIKQIVPRIPF